MKSRPVTTLNEEAKVSLESNLTKLLKNQNSMLNYSKDIGQPLVPISECQYQSILECSRKVVSVVSTTSVTSATSNSNNAIKKHIEHVMISQVYQKAYRGFNL